jgi:hypothetical protein
MIRYRGLDEHWVRYECARPFHQQRMIRTEKGREVQLCDVRWAFMSVTDDYAFSREIRYGQPYATACFAVAVNRARSGLEILMTW